MHEFHLYVEKNCIYYKNQKKKKYQQKFIKMCFNLKQKKSSDYVVIN